MTLQRGQAMFLNAALDSRAAELETVISGASAISSVCACYTV